jgi:hypothetical protein
MAGRILGHYRIVDKLRCGCTGVVYRAERILRLQKAKTAPAQPARGFCPKNDLAYQNPTGPKRQGEFTPRVCNSHS